MKAFGNNTAETHKDEKKMNLSWENFCTTCVHVKENDAQLISLSLRWHYSFLQNYFSHHKRKQSGYKCCKDYTASRFTAISIPRVLVKYMLNMLFWISRQFFPRVQLCWKSKQTVKKLKILQGDILSNCGMDIPINHDTRNKASAFTFPWALTLGRMYHARQPIKLD